MDNKEWYDLHGGDGDEGDIVKQTVEIDWGEDCWYECFAEVHLFRGIPNIVDIVGMIRHDNAMKLGQVELDIVEFPYYIKLAAEKKILEMM